MGHQLYYGFCKKCGGMYGTRNKKIVFNDCKCMKREIFKQMEKQDFENLNSILNNKEIDSSTKASQYQYWQKRINGRIEYLLPLMEECLEKGIEIATLSKELHQEWIELHEHKRYYNF